MQTYLYTFRDAIDSLLDWYGVDTTDAQTLRKAKRAVVAAYQHVTSVRKWSNYYAYGQIQTVASVTDGTVAYDQTGGSNEQMVTLTGSTWPSWAGYGLIQLDSIWYPVSQRISDTIITIDVNNNPGADIASGSSYVLARDTYPLPVNLQAMGTIRDVQHGIEPEYVMVDDIVSTRLVNQAPTWPWQYTILADPHYVGSMAIRFYPMPNVQLYYEYMYLRVPRPLVTYSYTTGTVTTSGTSLTGTGTTFTQNMVNSVIRFGSDASTPVTGVAGENPYVEQRVLGGYTSATAATLDQAPSADVSGVAYEISDPIDIEAPAMYQAFLRRCELEMGIIMNRDDVSKLMSQYREAEIAAQEKDDRSFAPKPGRGAMGRRVPLRWNVVNVV